MLREHEPQARVSTAFSSFPKLSRVKVNYSEDHYHIGYKFRMASSVDRNRKFSERIFQLLQYPRQRLSFSAHRNALMTKSVSTFLAFSSRFVDFAV